MYIHVYGLTVWLYRYSIKPRTHKKTPDSGSFAFPTYPDVVGCSSFSPHLSSCPSSSTLSSQIHHPHHSAPHHHTSAVVHTAVALSLSWSIRHSYQRTVCYVRALPTHNVTYWIVPSCVFSSTKKVEKCDPAVEAGLSFLHHHLYNTYFSWALKELLLPPLSITHK